MSARKNYFVDELGNLSREPFQRPAKKKSFVGKIILILFFLFLISGIFVSYKVFSAPEDVKKGGIFTQIKHLVTSSDKRLIGEEEDRVNIAIAGIGGGDHEGALLADTVILVSIEPSTKRVAMISAPRDLIVPIPGYGSRKINHAYALPEASHPGDGGKTLSSVLEKIFGVDVHYYFRINFEGFVKIIDDVGGITVNVEQKLNDPFYPIPGKENATTSLRYEHLVIEPGIRYMDGETALKYVRSRMAYGEEGSDFARSKRQQKVLLALKNNIFSPTTFFRLGKLNRIINMLSHSIDTNLEAWEILRLYDMGKEISSSNIINVVLDDSPQGYLQAIESEEFYGLVPKKKDWSDLQMMARSIFDPSQNISITSLETHPKETPALLYKTQQKETLEKEREENSLEIHNGTKINGLAKKTTDFLEKRGYRVISFRNAPVQTYKKSLLYDLNPESGKKRKLLLEELENLFGAIVFTSGAPSGILDTQGEKTEYPIHPKAHILIIIGEDWSLYLSKLLSSIQ